MLLRYLIVHVSVSDTGMTLILKQFWSIWASYTLYINKLSNTTTAVYMNKLSINATAQMTHKRIMQQLDLK